MFYTFCCSDATSLPIPCFYVNILIFNGLVTELHEFRNGRRGCGFARNPMLAGPTGRFHDLGY